MLGPRVVVCEREREVEGWVLLTRERERDEQWTLHFVLDFFCWLCEGDQERLGVNFSMVFL